MVHHSMHKYSQLAQLLQKLLKNQPLLLPTNDAKQALGVKVSDLPKTRSPSRPARRASAMATDAILETIKPRRSASREDLPVTTAGGKGGFAGAGGEDHLSGLRRRMSATFSARIQPLSSSSDALRRATSMPSVKALAAAGALRRWWDWGLDWVMARRPPFARGLEMSDDEAAALGGCHNRGTWRHVVHKLRAGARRLLGRDGRPHPQLAAQDFRYDSVSYAQNFDDGDAA
ncbi:hypothetical protein EJB05_48328, partial [Eragrostis curvula]